MFCKLQFIKLGNLCFVTIEVCCHPHIMISSVMYPTFIHITLEIPQSIAAFLILGSFSMGRNSTLHSHVFELIVTDCLFLNVSLWLVKVYLVSYVNLWRLFSCVQILWTYIPLVCVPLPTCVLCTVNQDVLLCHHQIWICTILVPYWAIRSCIIWISLIFRHKLVHDIYKHCKFTRTEAYVF